LLIRLSNQARTVLELPVPRVLSWSGDVENAVGSEFILMEEATGTQLGEVWDDMEIDVKLNIVDEIVAIQKKFLSLSFSLCDNTSVPLSQSKANNFV
jgi:hypothetical protein